MNDKPMKIAIISAPSQGKTTLVKGLVASLKADGHDAVEVMEMARDYIDICGTPQNPHEQVLIYLGQLEREQKVEPLYKILVCDLTVWMSMVYATLYTNIMDKKHFYAFNYLLEKTIKSIYNYDHCFYLPVNFDGFEDETRKDWNKMSGFKNVDDGIKVIDEKIKAYMTLFNVPFCIVKETDKEERIKFIRKTINI